MDRSTHSMARFAFGLGCVVLASQAWGQDKTEFQKARESFKTKIQVVDKKSTAVPRPPVEVFNLVEYRNRQGVALPAYATPDPKDGRKRPAIVWLGGGDTNSLWDVWKPANEANDQTAKAYRDAGLVMLFPGLRGGNGRAGAKEAFYGEVDDVLAATDYLARLPYVDPSRIFLGGHSTGATLALLVAAASSRYQAVFAFGPATSAAAYEPSLFGIDLQKADDEEVRMRSPYYWLDSLARPTFLIEGKHPSSNVDAFRAMCKKSKNPNLHCVAVADADHFSVLAPSNRLIATRLSATNSTFNPSDLKAELAAVGRKIGADARR